jgi:DNA-binding response OmpR family regulator
MMPGIDGFRFCEKIKNCTNTSHIPVILLTAMANIDDRITGLKWGADDYLTKPFNAEELRIRISNLIDSRNALRQKFGSNSIIKPGEISVSSHDAMFMEKLLGLVEKNMANIQYTVEVFAKDSGLSQSQLHRKLRAIVFMSAIQFIRSVRMHRAMELLKNGAGNIAEIAYMVGYDDPGYFSKTFRKFFDKLPSEVTRA